MKQALLTLIYSLLLIPFAFSQDKITTKSGDEIEAKVLEITPSEIKFTTADKANVLQILPKANVFMIKYENGKKDVFREEQIDNTTQAPASDQNPYLTPNYRQNQSRFGYSNYAGGNLRLQGQSDARRYYRNYKTAGTLTLVSSILYPPAGLPTAIGTSLTPPSRDNLGYPDENLFAQPEYAQAYKDQAKKIKAGKVWTNFGIGTGAFVVFYGLLFSAILF